MLTLLVFAACATDPADRRFREGDGLIADETVSVVIVGGGVGGLAVATELDEGLLLEGSDALGGRALLSGGLLYFVDYPEQAALGETDSVEAALEDWSLLTGEPPTDATTRWIESLGEIYDRICAMDLGIQDVAEDPIVHKHRLAMLKGGGEALASALVERVPEEVEIRTETWVDTIWMEEGRARGVILSDGAVIGADATVIASGGFASSVAWVSQLAEVQGLDYGAWGEAEDGGATGAALDWAAEHGWGTRGLDQMGWFRNSLGTPGANGHPLKLLAGPIVPWIWVNQAGERFVDESLTGSVSLSTPWQDQEIVWGLTTEEAFSSYVSAEDRDALASALADPARIVCEDSLSALVEAGGLDADTLQATLDAIEVARTTGEDDALKRPGTSFLDYGSGPLCLFVPGIQAQKSFGGLDVDRFGRVQDLEGDPVPNLYAVGEAAGMAMPGIGGSSGFDGALTAVLWSGWTVGAQLADGG